MNYFEPAILNTIKSAVNGVSERNINKLSLSLSVLENKLVEFDNEIENLLYTSMLNEDHPDVKSARNNRGILSQFTKGFTLYYVFLSDGATDYDQWANEYNNFYQTQPIDIFKELIPTGELDQSSEEYNLYIELKLILNSKEKTPDPIKVNYDTYYIYFTDTYKISELRRTKRLPGPDIDTWYFFRKIEDLTSYLKLYPPTQIETFLDSSRESPVNSVVVASCSIVTSIIQKLPPRVDNNLDIYAVRSIYDRFIRVDEIIDLQISSQQKRYGKVSFRSIGTGR